MYVLHVSVNMFKAYIFPIIKAEYVCNLVDNLIKFI